MIMLNIQAGIRYAFSHVYSKQKVPQPHHLADRRIALQGRRVMQKVLRYIRSAYNNEELEDLKVLAENVPR